MDLFARRHRGSRRGRGDRPLDVAHTSAEERRGGEGKTDEADAKIGEAKAQLEQTTSAVADSSLESFPATAADATAAAEAAQESVQAAKTAFEQVGDIVSALPENLRFAGVLVLVGAVLIGVATIQFGGVSIF